MVITAMTKQGDHIISMRPRPLTQTCFDKDSLLYEIEEVLCENPSSDSKYIH